MKYANRMAGQKADEKNRYLSLLNKNRVCRFRHSRQTAAPLSSTRFNYFELSVKFVKLGFLVILD